MTSQHENSVKTTNKPKQMKEYKLWFIWAVIMAMLITGVILLNSCTSSNMLLN